MDKLKKYRGEKGVVPVVKGGDCGLKRLSFDLLMFNEGRDYSEKTRGCEVCVVLLSGKCDASVDGAEWKGIGKRDDVFKGPATAVYAPRDSELTLTGAHGPFEAAIIRAETEIVAEPALVTPDKVDIQKRGKFNWVRYVHTVLGDSIAAGNMIVGETFAPPGNWSAFPPHRHDIDNPPHESDNEEIYFFRTKPPQGFQIIRMYNDSRSMDESLCVENNDAVIITDGYHPVIVAPGYRGYYLWALAGDKRESHTHTDPAHEWVDKT